MEPAKRILFDVGPMCNANCKFCYYSRSHKKRPPSFEVLKRRLELAWELGMEFIEFTGGEPTLRNDIFELIALAKKLGFRDICMSTNGIMFGNQGLAKKAETAGLEKVKLSIHSSKATIQDFITGTNNSFKNMKQGIKNIKETNLRIITNTTISRLNYKNIPDLTEFLLSMNPGMINLNFVIPIIDAENLTQEVVVKYSDAKPYLFSALKQLKAARQVFSVGYVPFCLMKGYENYVRNLSQIQYYLDGWDHTAKNKIEYGYVLSSFNQAIGYFSMIKHWHFPKENPAKKAAIESKLLRFAKKGRACEKCKYDIICDGLWRRYAELYGCSELRPSAGEKIEEPYFFMKK